MKEYLFVSITLFFAPGQPTPTVRDYYRDFKTQEDCQKHATAFNHNASLIKEPSFAYCIDKLSLRGAKNDRVNDH